MTGRGEDRGGSVDPFRRAVRIGVGGAILAFVALALLWMVCVPVFLTIDENRHVGYGLAVVHGQLPTMTTPLSHPFAALGQHGPRIWVAYHPPLYYALTGPVEWLGLHTGHATFFLAATRALGVCLTVVTILLAVALAREVTATSSPRLRATAMIAAAWLTATLASVVEAAGSIGNDPLMLVLTMATLLVLARALRRGLTGRATLVLGLLSTAGMLSRIAFLPIALLAIGSAFLLTVWPHLAWRRPPVRAALTGTGRSLLVTGMVAAGSGWFYALNHERYGSFSGALENGGARRDYTPGAGHGLLRYLLSPDAYWVQFFQIGGGRGNTVGLNDPEPISIVLGWVVIGTLVVAAVAGLVAVARRAGAGEGLDGPGRWMLLALLLTLLAAAVELGNHANAKGWPNLRYLLPGLAGWAVGVGLLLARAGRRIGPVLVVAASVGCVLGCVTQVVLVTRVRIPSGWIWQDLSHASWWDALVTRIGDLGIPAPALVLLALFALAAAGIVLEIAGLLAVLRAEDPGAPSAPSSDRRVVVAPGDS